MNFNLISDIFKSLGENKIVKVVEKDNTCYYLRKDIEKDVIQSKDLDNWDKATFFFDTIKEIVVYDSLDVVKIMYYLDKGKVVKVNYKSSSKMDTCYYKKRESSFLYKKSLQTDWIYDQIPAIRFLYKNIEIEGWEIIEDKKSKLFLEVNTEEMLNEECIYNLKLNQQTIIEILKENNLIK